jgi:dihydrolipoamide dehydrogenase
MNHADAGGPGARAIDLIVIGSGPGGYTAAIRGARAGLRTVLVERAEIGGVCLNWGCIPTKAMLHAAALWRGLKAARRHGITVNDASFDYAAVVRQSRQTVTRLTKGLELVFEQAGVEVVRGTARLDGREGARIRVAVEPGTAPGAGAGPAGAGSGVGGGVVGSAQVLTAPNVILATGSRVKSLPNLAYDGERLLTSRDAIVLSEVPPRVLVVGAGAIGLEFADLFATFGAQVTVVEILPRILPMEDEEVSAALRSALIKRGIKIATGAIVSEVVPIEGGVRCSVRPAPGVQAAGSDAASQGQEIEVDRVLVAVGVNGAVDGIGLETLGLKSEGGFLPVDGHLRTGAPGLYAIGDLVGPPLLAHTASSQGVHAAEHAAGLAGSEYDATWTPAAVFTHPQVASVGLREHELAARGLHARVGRFPFSALGKAVAEGEVAGFVKVLLEEGSDRLLGAHVVGPLASELIAELTLAGRTRVSAADLLHTIHTHPTLSEAIPEAFGAALGIGIHG